MKVTKLIIASVNFYCNKLTQILVNKVCTYAERGTNDGIVHSHECNLDCIAECIVEYQVSYNRMGMWYVNTSAYLHHSPPHIHLLNKSNSINLCIILKNNVLS